MIKWWRKSRDWSIVNAGILNSLHGKEKVVADEGREPSSGISHHSTTNVTKRKTLCTRSCVRILYATYWSQRTVVTSASPSILFETVFLLHDYVVRLANHLTSRFSCLCLAHQHRITGIRVLGIQIQVSYDLICPPQAHVLRTCAIWRSCRTFMWWNWDEEVCLLGYEGYAQSSTIILLSVSCPCYHLLCYPLPAMMD